MNNIHHTAIVSAHARLGKNVSVGPFCIIHENVEIGDNTIIEAYSEIGYPTLLAKEKKLIIGADSLIRSHAIIYIGSCFAEKLITGHRVTIRENTKAGINFHVGTQTDIQGDCEIGDYVRLHSEVHLGKLTKIGNFVWIFPYVVATNDPHPPSNYLIGVTIEDYASIGAASVLFPGIKVGRGSLVAAHSSVTRDVEAETVVRGSPAKKCAMTREILRKDGSNQTAYPWTTHFHRGYPQEIIDKWLSK